MLTRMAVFVSGGGTNLQSLIDAQNMGVLKSGRIQLVVSSNPSAFALDGFVGNVEAQRLDEIEPRAGVCTGTRDVSSVCRYLRLKQNNVDQMNNPPFCRLVCQNVIVEQKV